MVVVGIGELAAVGEAVVDEELLVGGELSPSNSC